MGRIIPYIMENKNCSKPPTRFTMTNRTRGTQRGTQRVALVSVTWQNDPWNIDQISSTMGHQGSSIGQKTSKSGFFFLKTWVPPNHPKVDHFRTPPYEPRHSHWTSSLSTMNPLWRREIHWAAEVKSFTKWIAHGRAKTTRRVFFGGTFNTFLGKRWELFTV